MQVKNLEQALKLQEEFKARLLESIEVLRKGKAPSIEAISKDRENLIARTQARLDSAVKEREAVLRQWEERIARLKEDVQRLQAGARDVKERVSSQAPQPVKAEARKAPGKTKPNR
jgi:chromosome segregation ATPase